MVIDILVHKLGDFLLQLNAWYESQTITHYRFVQVRQPVWSVSKCQQLYLRFLQGWHYQPPYIRNLYFQCRDVSFGAFPADRQLHRSRPQQEIPYFSGLSIFLLSARYSFLRENAAHCTFQWQHYERLGYSWLRDAEDDYVANNIDLLIPYYASVNKIYFNYMVIYFLSLAVI